MSTTKKLLVSLAFIQSKCMHPPEKISAYVIRWIYGFSSTFYITFLCVLVVFLDQKCENESSLDLKRLLFRLYFARKDPP